MRTPGLLVVTLLLLPVVARAQASQGPVRTSVGVARLDPAPAPVDSTRPFRFITPPPWMQGQPPATQQDTNDLSVRLLSRLESRMERNRNDRCSPLQAGIGITACRSDFQPRFDFDFNLVAGGRVANRIRVAVDYDSRREFDASNNISVAYFGRPGEVIQKVEVGNVSFVPPFSRFLSPGVPTGNYGVQAEGKIGALSFQALAAQQKGRVVRAESFTMGDQTLRQVKSQIDDYAFEPRRFFFTVDPQLLAGYPNIDILDGQEMLLHAAALPDTLRPARLALYRVLIGGQPPNPNGPQFIARGSRNLNRGLVYEHLREGIDYYADPSLLWIALARQLRRDERLVVAYTVRLGDGTTVYPPTGGTPDLEFTPAPQFANVLWDPELQAADSAFRREIRSAYRLAGEDLVRESTDLRIVTGPGEGQEKPPAAGATSWLELFGLAQPTNAASFDRDNRLWPRPTDPNFNSSAGGAGSPLVADMFVVFPSVRPFARDGLVTAGNPSNDTIYVMLSEDIYSSRRPQSVFRMHANFATRGDGESGALSLGNIQVRPGSERLVVDGVVLVRDIDYQVDYELGRVLFNRPDTLFARRREISIQYEENPFFAETPTSIFALAAQLPVSHGTLGFTAINQSQRSAFSRPPLGFEPAASLLASLNADFAWELPALARAFGNSPSAGGAAVRVPSLRLSAEVAMSRPNPNSRNTAYIESFQADGGLSANINDSQWYFSSQPAASALLPATITSPARAATLSWQNLALDAAGRVNTFRTEEIDPNVTFVGQFSTPEPLLWISLFPLSVGGTRNAAGNYDWSIAGAPLGTRWRSLRTSLSPSGADLTRVEHLEFWGLVDTTAAGRGANPTLVIDLGDVSENTLTFSPDSLLVQSGSGAFAAFRGKRIQGANVLNTERDPFSRAFDAAVNDKGLAGDIADRLLVFDATTLSPLPDSLNARTCAHDRRILALGDTRVNCTVLNARLDEEDLDNDGVLNFSPDAERLLRFAVNMADPATFDRVGSCLAAGDPRAPAGSGAPRCWVHFRIPISSAELIGSPILRRIKTLRLTLVSGAGAPDNVFTHLPLTRIRFAGAPWQKRGDRAITGIGGEGPSLGAVSASLIGTRDSSATISYQPPPGVREEAENRGDPLGAGQVQINERSLRLRATDMNVNERAEAFFRFPDGQKSFMGYTQLRVWARGRSSGWGDGGELNFFVRIGRDADNFYLFRRPANSGALQSAWEPEMRVEFSRFFALRAAVQDAFQRGLPVASSCTPTDSALVAASVIPSGVAANRHFACDGPYMIYTLDPAVSPPSLGAVQELSVGMVRIADGGGMSPIAPGDTLELWVDEIRLTGVVSQQGYAGHVGLELIGSNAADLRINISRRDRNFRQLAERPSFLTQDAIDVSSTVRLDQLTRAPIGWSLPLTVSHSTSLADPFFVSQSDIPGGVPGLRSPRDARTTYTLVARRSSPSGGSPFQDMLGGLTLMGSYSAANARTEYTDGRGASYTFGVDLDLGTVPDLRAGTDTATPLVVSRWAPSVLKLTSNLSRRSDSRLSFLNPVPVPGDPGSRVEGLSHIWRNAGALEFRPVSTLIARVDVNSDRDLRDYGDGSAAARAATASRSSFVGADIGMERERGLRGVLSFAPSPTSWLGTRFSLGTRFTMTRDPETRFLLADPDAPSDSLLPLRLAGAQQLSAGITLDLGQLARSITGDSLRGVAVSRVFTPLDLNFSRGLLSTFSASTSSPSLSYQFGLGGSELFRIQNGASATIAGASNTISAGHSIRPWPGATLSNRMSFTETRSWSGLAGNREYRVEGEGRTFPDLTLRLERRARDSAAFIRSAGAQAAVRHTVRNTLVPSLGSGMATDRSRDQVTTFPANVNVAWAAFGGFTTSAEYSLTLRDDLRPGIQIEGQARIASAEVTRTFPAGTLFGLSEDLRTRLAFTSSSNRSTITNSALLTRSRLIDNGRYSMNFTADSDVSETMVLSLGASQVVTYDRTFNRRFTQTFFSAVLHIDLSVTPGR